MALRVAGGGYRTDAGRADRRRRRYRIAGDRAARAARRLYRDRRKDRRGSAGGGRGMSLFAAACVIARRDYAATVLSRTFLLFLLGPLLPIVFAIAYGSLTAHSGTDEPARPVVTVAMEGAASDAVIAASSRIDHHLDG